MDGVIFFVFVLALVFHFCLDDNDIDVEINLHEW